MRLPGKHENNEQFSEYSYEKEDAQELTHKRHVRRLLEDKLEQRRLKEEFDELDGEFDWDDVIR